MTSSESAIEALLFDLGGVVIGIDWERVFAAWAAMAGVTAAEIERRFEFGEDYHRHERGELDDEAFFEATAKALALPLTARQVGEGWARIFTGPVPGMHALLESLAPRYPLYLFSNTNGAHYQQWASDYARELAPFRRMFLSHELGRRKPEPAAFAAIAAAIGVPLSRILFFDDTLVNVEGARAVGMPAAQVRGAEDVAAVLHRYGIDRV